MRKLLLLIVAIFTVVVSFAQSTANYAVTNGTTGSLTDANGTSVDMTTGTTQLIVSSTDQGTPAVTNIGFTFNFMGTAYTQFSTSANGIIRLGSTTLGTTTYAIGQASQALIAPFAGDLETSSTGKVHYKLVGSAPNRCLVVEFLNMGLDYTGSWASADGTFQARLYETSGVIEFVYGAMYRNSSTANSGSFNIGFSSGSAANSLLSITNTSTNATSTSAVTTLSYTTSATIADLNSSTDGSRKFYKFTPATLVAPSNITFSSIGLSSMTVGWTDNSTNEISFLITRATDAAFTTGVTTTTVTSTTTAGTGTTYSSTQTGLAANTTYYYSITALAENGSSGLTGNQLTTSCASGISGTKTVGPTGDYATITAALASGLSASTILELQSTYTSASETFPITIPTCTNSSVTLTIRPQTGATGLSITSSNTTATIDLNGASYVTIDGRPGGVGTSQLSIINTSTATGGSAVRFINEASNNTLKYLTLKSSLAGTGSPVILFSTTTGSNGNDNNTIDNCNIDGGAGSTASPTTGVASYGIYSVGTNTTTATQNSNNTISNCNVYDYFVTGGSTTCTGIFIGAGSTDWTIVGNSIYQTNTRTATVGGATINGIIISNSASGNNFNVTDNYFGGNAPLAAGTMTIGGAFANRMVGITFTGVTTVASSFQNNIIRGISLSTSSGATTAPGVFCGMYFTAGTFNVGTVTGNTIGSGTGTGSINVTTSTSGAISYGIEIAGGTTCNISNNTIGSLTFNGSTTSVGQLLYLIDVSSFTASSNLTINNNTLGSLTTSNSVNLPTAITGATAINTIVGIRVVTSNPVCIFTNNTISNLNNASVGSNSSTAIRGIQIAANCATTITGNTIRNFTTATTSVGTTTSASLLGISTTSTNTTTSQSISNNTIHTLNNTNTTAGVSVIGIVASWTSTSTTLTCNGNLIHSLRTGGLASSNIFGIYIGAGAATYSNNMIRLGLDETGGNLTIGQTFAGINEALGTNTIVHNSVYIGGTGVASSSNTYAFWAQQTTNTRVFRNNIFVNDRQNASGTAVNVAAQYAGTFPNAAGLTLNNNIYFARTAANTIRQGSTTYTLAAWKNYANADALSGVASDTTDINFINARGAAADVNLHVQGTTVAEAAGFNLTAITTDFDGQTRSGLTPVDIGADAGNFTAKDIFAPDISYTAISSPVYGTSNVTLSATITDVATGVINTGSVQPRIYFKKGSGSYFSSQGTRTSGTDNSGTWSFTIDYSLLGGVIAGDVISYYIIAQDNASTPNMNSNPLNATATDVNTVSSAPTTPNSYTVQAGITWFGTTSTDWNDGTNWSTGVVPTASDNITINNTSGNMPVVGTGVTATAAIVSVSSTSSTLSVSGTGSLAVTSVTNSGTITVSGGSLSTTTSITNSGIITVSGGSLSTTTSITNSGTITVNGGTLSTTTTLTNNASSTITASSGALNVATTFSNAGTFNASGATVNVTGASGSGITNTGTFNLSSNSITIASSGNNNRQFSSTAGSLNVTGGTLNIFGNFSVTGGGFTQSAGLISIDANNGTVSTASGVHHCVINTAGTINASGGIIRLVNPPLSSFTAGSTRSVYVDGQSNATSFTGTHTFEFGDGISTVPGSATDGFAIECYSSSRLPIHNVTVNSANGGLNRFVRNTFATGNGTYIKGDLTINSGGEFRWVTAATGDNAIGGNLINNGTMTSLTEVGFGVPSDASTLYTPSASQTISGTGVFQNALSGATSQFSAFVVNNSAGSVTFNSSLSPTFSSTITTTGTLNATSISLNGSSSQTATINASSSVNVTNFTLNNSLGATLNGSGFLNVTGTVTSSSGTLAAGGRLVLKSTSTSTARIAAGTGTYMSGNIIQERFIPAKSTRRFSFIASPVSQALSAAWQQQVHITGTGTGGTACPTLTAHSNGFDATTTNAPSMFSYDASQASGSRWVANSTGTTGFTLTPGTGYRLNVRGPRTTGCSLLDGTTSATTAVTLSATGAISNAQKNLGSFSNTYNNNVAGNWVLIGNPYPSELDFTAFRTDAANANANQSAIANAYIIYDPANAPDAVTPANMYSTWNAGTWSNAPTSISNANGQYIANGQAFFVQAAAASNLTLNFAEAYKANVAQNGVFRQRSWNDIIRIGLNKENVNIDNTVIRYANDNNISNTAITDLDATLLSTSNSYLGTLKAGKTTSIQTRQLQTLTTDTVAVDFNVAASGAYSFNFSEHDNFSATNIYLIDSYTKTIHDVKASSTYSFTVDKNNAATQTNRFALVFSKAIPTTAITGVKVYPNPADKQITVQLPSTSDKYTVSITDVTGKRVYQSQLASGIQSINVAKFTAGNYIIEITDAKGNRTTEKLVKQ